MKNLFFVIALLAIALNSYAQTQQVEITFNHGHFDKLYHPLHAGGERHSVECAEIKNEHLSFLLDAVKYTEISADHFKLCYANIQVYNSVAHGFAVYDYQLKQYLILLEDNKFDALEPLQQKIILLHEFAHVVEDHARNHELERKQQEGHADELAGYLFAYMNLGSERDLKRTMISLYGNDSEVHNPEYPSGRKRWKLALDGYKFAKKEMKYNRKVERIMQRLFNEIKDESVFKD